MLIKEMRFEGIKGCTPWWADDWAIAPSQLISGD